MRLDQLKELFSQEESRLFGINGSWPGLCAPDGKLDCPKAEIDFRNRKG